MNWLKKIFETIKNNVVLRNLVIALCAIILAIFLVNLLLNIYTRHGQKLSVPNFTGMTVAEAQSAATAMNLRLEVIDSLYMAKSAPGAILDQNPKAGMHVKSGRGVFLTINSFRPKMEVIPYVTGFSLRQAKNKLESRGFEIEKLVYKTDIATNNVLEERFAGQLITASSETSAELGSGVVLTVGVDRLAPLPRVPKLVGLTLREAKSRLWEVGLNLGSVRNDPDVTAENIDDAKVYRQTPGQQSRSEYGAAINLFLTSDNTKVSSGIKESDAEAVKVVKEEEDTGGENTPMVDADAEMEKMME